MNEVTDLQARRDYRDALEELYENNCARADQMIWDTKTGKSLPLPQVQDALLVIREGVWRLDRILRELRGPER